MRKELLTFCLMLSVCVEGAGVAGPTSSAGAVPSPSPHTRLAVLDVELSGDLGGPELAAEHEVRLQMATVWLREALQRSDLFQLVDNVAAQDVISRLRSQQRYLHDCNGCDLEVGRKLEADQVLVAWVNRVSGLILTLSYEIHDVATGQIAARKSFDFRGDNDTAWKHAIDYMVRDLKEQSAR